MRNVFFILIILLISSFFGCLMFGGGRISIEEVITGLFHPQSEGVASTIIWQIRIPRVILGFLVGAGLAASGCVFQGLLRNPLAEPYTLGVSGGAAFGATIGVILELGSFWLPGCAFLGALLSISLVYLVASIKRFSIPTLVLGGVILSFLFSSMVMFIFAISQSDRIHSCILWLMGDLSVAEPNLIKLILIFILIGVSSILIFSRDLNILTLGEEKATHLGVEVIKVKRLLFIITSFITGGCVSASGIIGFVGLIIPHFMRQLIGPNHVVLIPASVLAGAIFLSLCDCLARTIIAPQELPVGVITGILGGIFFLTFLLRAKRWEIF
ncbi:MAG: iron ABC transporter permease [bacterium]|nr:iron ABC transporter permease [bacterium]